MTNRYLTPRGTRYGVLVLAFWLAIAYALIAPDTAECANCAKQECNFVTRCLSGCACFKKPGEAYGVCLSLSLEGER